MHSFCAVVSFFVVYPLSQSLRLCQLPKGAPFGAAAKFPATAKSRPLGEGGIAAGDDGRGASRRAALSRKAARQLPFPSTTPSVKLQIKIIFPLQRRRPPPVAETGRSCWGSGQQDASAAQGTMRMLGAATRKKRRAFKSLPPRKRQICPPPFLCPQSVVY